MQQWLGKRIGLRLTHKEVISIWIWTTNTEQLHQVVELPMDIAAHRDGAFLRTPLLVAAQL